MIVAIAGAMALGPISTWAEPSPFSLHGTWWQQPAQQTRHTTLVASFDSTENNNADYARDLPEPSGWGMMAEANGLHGSATELEYDGAHLQYRGSSNFQAMHGTLRMQVKGDALASPDPFWLFEARAIDRANGAVGRIGVKREPDRLSLLILLHPRMYAMPVELGRLDLEIGELSSDRWHSIVASWDRDAGTGWIALDGEGVSGPIEFSSVTDPAHMIFVGGGAEKREPGGVTPAGLMIDDFLLYDLSLPLLEAEPANLLPAEDVEFLPQAEAAVRKTLSLVADLQNLGGWSRSYTWPTLEAMWWPNEWFVHIDKGNTSMATIQDFTYGHDVLGDYRYVEVMLRKAEFLLAGQSPEGYWAYSYQIKPTGAEGFDMANQIKIQDHVQEYPMFFLIYAYRLTGDERYRDAAVRTGEFFLRIQNPDGSYSHHYDPRTGIGRTHTNEPQGRELNDEATNTAIDVLAMMYHLTGNAAYVRAIERVGDWLVNVQGDDIPLWASQYDNEGNPIWARDFEPPAYGSRDSEQAMDALLEICRFSGDDRYLEPVRKAIAWMEDNLPNGMMYFYHELGTGKPIAGENLQIYHLDVPEEMAQARTFGLGAWTFEQRDVLSYARGVLRSAERGRPNLSATTVESALAELPRWRNIAKDVMATQNEAGVWLWYDRDPSLGAPDGPMAPTSCGPYFRVENYEVRYILRYIELARIVSGELPVEPRAQGNLRTDAYPYSDWHNLDWAANAQ